jgi:hypothetical protein
LLLPEGEGPLPFSSSCEMQAEHVP